MAETPAASFSCRDYTEDKQTSKERKNRIRKPLVEKMRRDRINLSINQLRKLLEQGFQLLQPDSKPEKSDILEIAVLFLKQQMCSSQRDNKAVTRNCYEEYSHGYSKCLHETLSFLSIQSIQEESHVKLLDHFHQIEPHAGNQTRRPRKSPPQPLKQEPLWRPW
ncbi:transcription factor HES-5-like [Pelodytes ibericus]